MDSDSGLTNKNAPILFIIGTMVMCCGLITCAALIGKSIQEISYEHRKGSDRALSGYNLIKLLAIRVSTLLLSLNQKGILSRLGLFLQGKLRSLADLHHIRSKTKKEPKVKRRLQNRPIESSVQKGPRLWLGKASVHPMRQKESAWRSPKSYHCSPWQQFSLDIFYNSLAYGK